MKINSDECSRTVWTQRMLWDAFYFAHTHFCFVFQKLPVLKAVSQEDLFKNGQIGFPNSAIWHFFCISCHMIDSCDHIRMVRMLSSLNKVKMTIGFYRRKFWWQGCHVLKYKYSKFLFFIDGTLKKLHLQSSYFT